MWNTSRSIRIPKTTNPDNTLAGCNRYPRQAFLLLTPNEKEVIMTLTIATAKVAYEAACNQSRDAYRKLKVIEDERRAKVKALDKQRKALIKQIDAVNAEYKPALDAAHNVSNEYQNTRDDAFDTLARVQFEDAQARIESEVSPKELAEGINSVLDSKREWHPDAGSLGVQIVIELCRGQRWRGFVLMSLQACDCMTIHGGFAAITAKQADRVWLYLESVCPQREDGGLAPPFKIEWNTWWNNREHQLNPMLAELLLSD